MRKKIKEAFFMFLKITIGVGLWMLIVAGATYLAIKVGMEPELP